MKTKSIVPKSNISLDVISEKEKKMLELLSKGGTSKIVAASLGYTDGTARVYLHNMYKNLGVSNKTGAVGWYLERIAKRDRQANDGLSEGPTSATSFGDFAVKTDLNACLGVMSIFIGPHSKLWEIAQQLNNANPERDPDQTERMRARSRRLWNALLKGEFAEAKREFDAGHLPRIFVESITDAFVVAAMLHLGGFTGSAKKAVNAISSRQGASIGISRDERAVLAAIADAVERRSEQAVAALTQLAAKNAAKPVFRQMVSVALFHIHKMRGDTARARECANAIWVDAEAARQHLQSIGVKFLTDENQLPNVPKISRIKLNQYFEKILA